MNYRLLFANARPRRRARHSAPSIVAHESRVVPLFLEYTDLPMRNVNGSITLQIFLVTLMQISVIAYGWSFLVVCLGQAAQYVPAGWWASLMGVFVGGMACFVPLGALLVGVVSAYLLGLRNQKMESATIDTSIVMWLIGFLAVLLLHLIAARCLWLLYPPRATENSSFGAGFMILFATVGIIYVFLSTFAILRLLKVPSIASFAARS